MSKAIFKSANSTYPVNLLNAFMIQIKSAVIVIGEIRDYTAGDGDAHAYHINADEHTVLQDAVKRNKEIVLYHVDTIANKRANNKLVMATE